MTDIVERLRDWHEKVHCRGVIDLSMALEAADEIVHLRLHILGLELTATKREAEQSFKPIAEWLAKGDR